VKAVIVPVPFRVLVVVTAVPPAAVVVVVVSWARAVPRERAQAVPAAISFVNVCGFMFVLSFG
jgi:hypothetical protein